MSWTQDRARVAALSRTRTRDDPDLVSARQTLKAERLAEHVAKVLAEAPPLSDGQRERIAALLRVNPERPQAGHADLGLADTSPSAIGDDV